jgi:hypothetical protein
MKKEIADKWVEALRSGHYKQTRGRLRDTQGYCCLGVLCEISGLSKFNEENKYLGKDEILPELVRGWSGMISKDGTYTSNDSLAGDNDDGMVFSEIADTIEKCWEEL